MKTKRNYLLTLVWVLFITLPDLIVAQETPQLTDPEIASVAVVANQIDINYAEVALRRSSNESIKEFAHNMKTDYKAVIDRAEVLVTNFGVRT